MAGKLLYVNRNGDKLYYGFHKKRKVWEYYARDVNNNSLDINDIENLINESKENKN